LPSALKKERVDRLLAVASAQKQRYMQSFIGKEVELVPENCFDGYTEGYSENYMRVYVEGDIGKEPVHVFVTSLYKDGVMAKIK
jgi:threonylcarbamoyladenosine tRNA methylthiotransferase MtaB